MQITTDELRRMTNQEGLILQGCGGDAQEWVDGINELLTQEGILLEGTKFKNVKSFRNEGLTIQSAHRMNQSGGKNRLEQEAGEAAFLQGMSL